MASVSVDELGPRRFKVRWREVVQEGGVRRIMARAQTVSSREAAIELQANVLRAIETVGFYEPEGREVAEVANLELAAAAWLKHKAARGASDGTVRKYAGHMARFFATVRALRGLEAAAPVPASVLNRSLFSDAVLRWRAAGLGESTVYGATSTALDMWRWVCDDPVSHPGVPPCPRDPSTVLPLAPVYSAPEPPTLAEVDACLRQLRSSAHVSRAAAVIMRFTGLRVSQVLAIRWEDVDLAAATLRVRLGKTRREQAQGRTVPISPHLLAELALGRGEADIRDPVVTRRKDQRATPTQSHQPSAVLSAAWEAATEAGEVRRGVWAPDTRQLARPDHAFRAAFMAFLEAEGVRDSVIDFLVGHAPASTRRRHYAPPGMDQVREAVAKLPPVDWREAPGGPNVLRMRRG